MMRERTLQVVLVVAGSLFVAGVYPGAVFFFREPAVAMIMSIYVTLGVFLLLAVRNPGANRGLIAFAGWANVAHAGVMAVQEYRHVIQPQELGGVVLFGIVGVVLIALGPGRQARELAAASDD
jgi:succinate-acetate transporter protein